ncbi:MAG: hypothetical protein Hyperionvirus20_4 [Hyperionvirus sp.]|uniref:Uncharacterized protein n=1 Tax=Hyperionvirus sp. TaxID=2487770 RepID=A0A3G5AAF0_9VIRU|nr:MAG: hypothetical protein Hyperionvirus20_4 [Hyperionvirus sp.]
MGVVEFVPVVVDGVFTVGDVVAAAEGAVLMDDSVEFIF